MKRHYRFLYSIVLFALSTSLLFVVFYPPKELVSLRGCALATIALLRESRLRDLLLEFRTSFFFFFFFF